TVIVTAPDRPVGRKQILTAPSVKIWGQERNIPVIQPEGKLDDAFLTELSSHNCELNVVVAYGKIIPTRVITATKFGTINVHYSLLPKWRGASPIEAAILNGDSETGITIQQMVFALDEGPVLMQKIYPLNGSEFAYKLKEIFAPMGGEMLAELLPKIESREVEPLEQDDSQATYKNKFDKSEGEVDLDEMSDDELWRRWRAYYGWPGMYYFETTPSKSQSSDLSPSLRSGSGGTISTLAESSKPKRVIVKDAEFENGKFIIKKILHEGESKVIEI
ncbi:MAG: methionyl-tRNA formyltransferase, partial [Candidatus Nomurabacteria bacterium]|nr:methionyl-tRNA formyltransferase [Candidatus Nomurabacteria bacterium]